MCGRYTIFTKAEALEERFHAKMSLGEYVPNYNADPSQNLPVILNSNKGEIVRAHWGFLPHWVKDPAHTKALINARVETAAEKPYFRSSFEKRRCLVLADGFYEWDKKGGKKIPYRIALHENEPFAFAGIWDTSKDDRDALPSFAILTTAASPFISRIHTRMPIILHKENEMRWLEGEPFGEDIQSILESISDSDLEMYKVSEEVNKPSFNTRSAIDSIDSIK